MMVYFPPTPQLEKLHYKHGLTSILTLAVDIAINTAMDQYESHVLYDEAIERLNIVFDNRLKTSQYNTHKLNLEYEESISEFDTLIDELVTHIQAYSTHGIPQVVFRPTMCYEITPKEDKTMNINKIYTIPHTSLNSLVSYFILPCLDKKGIKDQAMIAHYIKQFFSDISHMFLEPMVNETPENIVRYLIILRDSRGIIPYHNEIAEEYREGYVLSLYQFLTQMQTILMHNNHYYEKNQLNAHCLIDELNMHYLNVCYIYE